MIFRASIIKEDILLGDYLRLDLHVDINRRQKHLDGNNNEWLTHL